MNRVAEWLLDLLFPPRCVFCGKVLGTRERDLCGGCQNTLPWLEGREAEQNGEFFSLCVSPLRYRDNVRESIRRYKFYGHRGYRRIYGKLLAQCIRNHLDGRQDLISWAPLSEKRRKERGYDQAFLLASAAALELSETAAATLRKSRHTAAQSGLEEDGERQVNVLDAYEVIDPQLVRGKRVLLVDDVVTTGATLSECARILRGAGAKDVVCATLARSR